MNLNKFIKLAFMLAFFILTNTSCTTSKLNANLYNSDKCTICETVKGDRETFCWEVYKTDAQNLLDSNTKKKSSFYWIP